MASAYMDAYGATPESFMKVGIKNHQNGALNEKAQFGKTIQSIMEGKISKAKDKGFPTPTWKDELDFLNDLKANPVIQKLIIITECC